MVAFRGNENFNSMNSSGIRGDTRKQVEINESMKGIVKIELSRVQEQYELRQRSL